MLCGSAAAEESLTGTLHRGTLRDWHQATSANQLATRPTSSSASSTSAILSSAPKARDVQSCINRVSANFALRGQLVFDTAVACMAELGYLRR